MNKTNKNKQPYSKDAKQLWDKVDVLLGTLEELGETFGNLIGTPLGTLETHSVQPF
jgi:hypothetical protein